MKLGNYICLLFISLSALFDASIAIAQTQEEIENVALKLGRPQTKSSTCSFLAGQFEATRQFSKAIEYYRKMLDIYREDPALGDKSPKYAWALTKIALCESKRGNVLAARKLCKEALTIVERRNTENDAIEVAYLEGIQTNCSFVLGKPVMISSSRKKTTSELKGLAKSEISNLHKREAETLASLKASEKYGKSSFAYLKVLLNLANIYTLEEKFPEAKASFSEVISVVERLHGKESPMLLTPLSNYGFMLQSQGKQQEAQAILNRMKTIATKAGSK